MSATQVKMERETMFKYKQKVKELEAKLLHADGRALGYSHALDCQVALNDELKAKLADKESELAFKSSATYCEHLSMLEDKLAEAQKDRDLWEHKAILYKLDL